MRASPALDCVLHAQRGIEPSATIGCIEVRVRLIMVETTNSILSNSCTFGPSSEETELKGLLEELHQNGSAEQD